LLASINNPLILKILPVTLFRDPTSAIWPDNADRKPPMILKNFRKAGYYYLYWRKSTNRRDKDEYRPIAEKKSWTEIMTRLPRPKNSKRFLGSKQKLSISFSL
jgi:hypothetical protein